MLCVCFFLYARFFWGEQEAMNESFFIDSLVACINHCMLLFYHNSCTVCIETPICWPNSSGHRDISQNLRVLVLSVSPCTASGGASRQWTVGSREIEVNRLESHDKKKRVVSSWNCTLNLLQKSSRSVVVLYMRGFFLEQPEVFFLLLEYPKMVVSFDTPKKCFFCPQKILTPKTGGVSVILEDPKTAKHSHPGATSQTT